MYRWDEEPEDRMARFRAMDEREATRVSQLIQRDRAATAAELRHHTGNAKAVMKGRPARLRVVDTTPERLAMVDSDFVNPATIDSSEQRIGRVRRLIADPLDRLKRSGAITLRQYDAGDWWRTTAQAAGIVHSGRQGYEPQSRGSPMYGQMPKSERAMMARHSLRMMWRTLSPSDVARLDLLCVAGEFGARGRAGQGGLVLMRLSLDRLAFALRLPGER